MDNVEEMDKFLKKYNFPKLDQEEIGNLEEPTHFEKTLMLGKIEGKEKGITEDEMVGWHHRLIGHEV